LELRASLFSSESTAGLNVELLVLVSLFVLVAPALWLDETATSGFGASAAKKEDVKINETTSLLLHYLRSQHSH
jgi:hypothetical protein